MSQSTLSALLNLRSQPVAISFVATPPDGVTRVAAPEPAGCGYWRRAAEGEVFYTEAADHKGCLVGAHTHNVALSEVERTELKELIGVMASLEYIKRDEVARIPARTMPFEIAVYAPLASAPLAPDVVLVRGNAQQLMLLAEAAQAAGVSGAGPAMGRPTCAVIPEAIASTRTSASFGCIGNRVYTGADDSEAYFAIPGAHLAAVEDRLAVTVRANQALERFHLARQGSDGRRSPAASA
jgi:uncharacterized protein (DUF169 family)